MGKAQATTGSITVFSRYAATLFGGLRIMPAYRVGRRTDATRCGGFAIEHAWRFYESENPARGRTGFSGAKPLGGVDADPRFNDWTPLRKKGSKQQRRSPGDGALITGPLNPPRLLS